MKGIQLTLTAQAALAIGRQNSGGSIREVESYIPGSAIRGTIAAQILNLSGRGHQDLSKNGGEFQALFLGGRPAIFHNAYPAIARITETQAQNSTDPIHCLPATAVSSKTEPGFKMEGKDRGGVFDTVIDRACAERCNHFYDPSCPKDGGRVEPISGFYSRSDRYDLTHRHRSHSISTRFLTRVGINRRRATAQDSLLYSTEVLNESFVPDTQATYSKWEYNAYRSQVWIDDDGMADALKNYLDRHSDTFRIGGGASRGLGKVQLKTDWIPPKNGLLQRIEDFNQAFRDRWKLWSVFGGGELGDRVFFTIDLQADAIFTEQWQRTMVLSANLLKGYAHVQDDSLKLETAYSSYDYRGGWNSAWGLMKDIELLTNKGSVYLFSTNQPELWTEALQRLECLGVGDRTCEGYGQILVCDELHQIFRENAV